MKKNHIPRIKFNGSPLNLLKVVENRWSIYIQPQTRFLSVRRSGWLKSILLGFSLFVQCCHSWSIHKCHYQAFQSLIPIPQPNPTTKFSKIWEFISSFRKTKCVLVSFYSSNHCAAHLNFLSNVLISAVLSEFCFKMSCSSPCRSYSNPRLSHCEEKSIFHRSMGSIKIQQKCAITHFSRAYRDIYRVS